MFGFASPLSDLQTYQTVGSYNNLEKVIVREFKGVMFNIISISSFEAMGSLFNDLLSSTFSSTSNIESSDKIFFSYHVVGLVLGQFRKSLLLVYMYTKFST